MFHSCFNDSAFTFISDRLLTFAVSLHRLKFPANVRVHIASVFCVTVLQYQQHLSFHNTQQKSLSVQCTFHHRLVFARFVLGDRCRSRLGVLKRVGSGSYVPRRTTLQLYKAFIFLEYIITFP